MSGLPDARPRLSKQYATARKLWLDVERVCASTSMTLPEYVDSIGDTRLVLDMMVGAQQRLMIYPQQGFMIEQETPDDITAAFERLCGNGFTGRLVSETADQT